MDEPFGAVDPITRQRLQDELLRIQAELQKTIVIVTHDFDEAVKLGDWIVVFAEGARIVQYDTPERILAEPADAFVEEFIGSGAGLKQLTLRRVDEVPLADAVIARPGDAARDVLARMDEVGHQHAVVLDGRDRPLRWPSRRALGRIDALGTEIDPRLPVVGARATLNDALDTMLVSSAGAALVTGRGGAFLGVIDVETVMDAITSARASAAGGQDDAPVGTNTGTIGTVGADAERAAQGDAADGSDGPGA